MRTPIWIEHARFFRGAAELLEALAGPTAAYASQDTRRVARNGSKSAMPTIATSRHASCLSRISRGTTTLDTDQAHAEIVRIAIAHGVPMPAPDFTAAQRARQILAAIAPLHREIRGDLDDGWDETDVGLPEPLREGVRK